MDQLFLGSSQSLSKIPLPLTSFLGSLYSKSPQLANNSSWQIIKSDTLSHIALVYILKLGNSSSSVSAMTKPVGLNKEGDNRKDMPIMPIIKRISKICRIFLNGTMNIYLNFLFLSIFAVIQMLIQMLIQMI